MKHRFQKQRSVQKILKRRVTLNLPDDLLERLRDAVYWTPGLTLASCIAKAINESLDIMEATNGEPFPKRIQELKAGRPPRQPLPSVSQEIRHRIQSDNLTLQL
ncbi:MAG: hypothetical protein ACT4OO_03965 [Nitrospiraceae bacterium]